VLQTALFLRTKKISNLEIIDNDLFRIHTNSRILTYENTIHSNFLLNFFVLWFPLTRVKRLIKLTDKKSLSHFKFFVNAETLGSKARFFGPNAKVLSGILL
jgi:hypothetical protein